MHMFSTCCMISISSPVRLVIKTLHPPAPAPTPLPNFSTHSNPPIKKLLGLGRTQIFGGVEHLFFSLFFFKKNKELNRQNKVKKGKRRLRNGWAINCADDKWRWCYRNSALKRGNAGQHHASWGWFSVLHILFSCHKDFTASHFCSTVKSLCVKVWLIYCELDITHFAETRRKKESLEKMKRQVMKADCFSVRSLISLSQHCRAALTKTCLWKP